MNCLLLTNISKSKLVRRCLLDPIKMISACIWRETPRERCFAYARPGWPFAVNYATSTQQCKRRPGHPQPTSAHWLNAECVGVHFGSIRPLDPAILTIANRNSSIELHFDPRFRNRADQEFPNGGKQVFARLCS